ncbi:hypothetical protein, partial [Bacteriovorax sp. DB6_IX]|uniref:hypothetical protein n=1 Tax=Bacteriovorax sp. DB6_IX TaxID=1353530 RepID=UPI000389F0DE
MRITNRDLKLILLRPIYLTKRRKLAKFNFFFLVLLATLSPEKLTALNFLEELFFWFIHLYLLNIL